MKKKKKEGNCLERVAWVCRCMRNSTRVDKGRRGVRSTRDNGGGAKRSGERVEASLLR